MEHSKYMKETVIPKFGEWVNGFATEVSMAEAQKNGMIFLKNHVDPLYIKNRGEVYELFEDMSTFADLAKVMAPNESVRYSNMQTLAKGIVWAVEHDGFDTVKYDDLSMWGKDIVNVM